jgi:hypothetical protein
MKREHTQAEHDAAFAAWRKRPSYRPHNALSTERNVSKRYNPDWASQDNHVQMDFLAKHVSGKVIDDGDDFDSGYHYWVYVSTNKPITDEQFRELCYTNYRQGCSCEHDCCGHYFGNANTSTMKHNKKRTKWAVELHYAPNF